MMSPIFFTVETLPTPESVQGVVSFYAITSKQVAKTFLFKTALTLLNLLCGQRALQTTLYICYYGCYVLYLTILLFV